MLIIIILAILIAAVLCGSYICYRLAFYHRPRPQSNIYAMPSGAQYEQERETMLKLIEEFEQRPYEQVWITSEDGLRLSGRYYHVRDGAALQIQCHGFKGSSIRDFCGGNKLALEAGHNSLVIDQRAHGLSQGHTISFGVKEYRDCLAWVNYAVGRFGADVEIILCGVSMGAATVLMAGSSNPPKNVKGIIADCPFSVYKDVLHEFCLERMNLNSTPLWPLVRLGAAVFGGFDPKNADVVKFIKNCRIPVLFIHGEGDRLVPFRMSKDLFDACPSEKYFFSVPDAGHGLSYLFDSVGYKKQVQDFLKICGVEYQQ